MTSVVVSLLKDEPSDEENVCSCCLSSANLTSMIQYYICNQGKMENYFNIMNRCYDSKILNPSASLEIHYICEMCIKRLVQSYKFKCQVIESQKTLLECRKNRVNDTKQKVVLPPNDQVGKNVSKINLDLGLDENSEADDESIVNDDDFDCKYSEECFKLEKPADETFDTMEPSSVHQNSNSCGKQNEKQNTKQTKQNGSKVKAPTRTKKCFRTYSCEKCGMEFGYSRLYARHLSTHETTFQCKQCAKVFDKKTKLKDHTVYHHSMRHVCPICKEKFKHYEIKKKHLRDFHFEQANMHSCGDCSELCLTAAKLKAHRLTHHSVRERTHNCTLCDKGFFTSDILKCHMAVHTGERLFNCEDCGKGFVRKNSFVQHMKIHRDIREHLCDHCGLGFVQKCSLKLHMKKHT